MYSTAFEGKKIRIRNSHMKKLLERFDESNFKLTAPADRLFFIRTHQMQNITPCVLCKAFNPHKNESCGWFVSCRKCPFNAFSRSGRAGCHYILDVLLSHRDVINIYIGSVVYLMPNRTQALKDLKIVTDFLKSFKRE